MCLNGSPIETGPSGSFGGFRLLVSLLGFPMLPTSISNGQPRNTQLFSVSNYFSNCLLVAAPLKWSKPQKRVPFFSRVTEQLRICFEVLKIADPLGAQELAADMKAWLCRRPFGGASPFLPLAKKSICGMFPLVLKGSDFTTGHTCVCPCALKQTMEVLGICWKEHQSVCGMVWSLGLGGSYCWCPQKSPMGVLVSIKREPQKANWKSHPGRVL